MNNKRNIAQGWYKRILANLWFQTVVFAACYYGLVLVSRRVSFPTASFPTLWLPSGLFVAVLLLSDPRRWPVYLIAALPGSLTYGLYRGYMPVDTLIFYLASLLEAATGAWLIRSFNARREPDSPGKNFSGPVHVFGLIVFSAVLSSALSATISTTVLATVNPGLDYFSTWRIAWVGHGLGILTLAPLILSTADVRTRSFLRITPENIIEFAILLSGVLVCSLYIFIRQYSLTGPNYNYIIVPFLVWAALRFGLGGVSLNGLLVTLISAWGILQHVDPFAHTDSTIVGLISTQGSFLAIILITCYTLATVWMQRRETQSALVDSESRYRVLVENQGEGIGIVNSENFFTFANPVAAQIFGLSQEELVGKSLRDFTDAQQFEIFKRQTGLSKQNQRTSYELEIAQPHGQRRSLLVTATPQFGPNGSFSGTFIVFRDMTDRKQSEMALRDSRARLQTLFDHSPIPIWEEDFSRVKRLLNALRKEGVEDFHTFFTEHPEQVEACERLLRILDVNQAALQLFGFTDKAAFLSQAITLVSRGPKDIFVEELVAIAEDKTEFEMEGPNDLVDNTVRYHYVRWAVAPGYEANYRRVIVTIIDVTERKQAEERMRYLSTHDVLTGLYNRNFFEAEMERMQNSRLEPVNVMLVDVNGMKTTNDAFGHAAGDDLLRRTAQVLRLSFRKEDVIARIGGDEFVVLFHGSISLPATVERVKECLREHNHWYDGPALSLAIGAASGGKGVPLLDLYKKADQQMYKEKNRSRRVRAEARDARSDGKTGNSPTSSPNSPSGN